MTIEASESELEKVRKQLSNLIEVIKVVDLKEHDAIIRDLCLMKVHTKNAEARTEVMQLAESYGAKIADASLDSLILELADEHERLDRLIELMKHLGINQLFRTGITAIARD